MSPVLDLCMCAGLGVCWEPLVGLGLAGLGPVHTFFAHLQRHLGGTSESEMQLLV